MKEFEIKNAKNFKITLPNKGKYQLHLQQRTTAYTYYPSRITNNKKT
jgi:hypothetical protein